jgi:hypothetical protein
MTSRSCEFTPEILHVEKESFKLDILERLEIVNSDGSALLSEQLFRNHSPLLNVSLRNPNMCPLISSIVTSIKSHITMLFLNRLSFIVNPLPPSPAYDETCSFPSLSHIFLLRCFAH